MTVFLAALTTIILPILLIVVVGFVLGRSGLINETRSLARAALYFFTPALVLNSVARSRLSDTDFVTLLVYSLLVAAVTGALAFVLARLLDFDRLLSSAFLLSIIFVNAGNIGLPFNQFAFGQPGLARASVYFVSNAVLTQTLAVYIASLGHAGIRESAIAVFKMPLVYAVVLGIVINRANLALPEPLARALELSAAAAVPLMLAILGVELARTRLAATRLPLLLATALKLLVTPAIALVIAEVMGMRGVTRSVAVLEASMPTAVNASLIAMEFDSRPDFVTSAVLLTTLGSIVTLVVLLVLLGQPPV